MSDLQPIINIIIIIIIDVSFKVNALCCNLSLGRLLADTSYTQLTLTSQANSQIALIRTYIFM